MRKFLLFLLLLGCTNETESRRTLEAYGFTEIRFTGYQPWACSEDDQIHTGFIARNPQGMSVDGVVCCGFLKSCTVRF